MIRGFRARLIPLVGMLLVMRPLVIAPSAEQARPGAPRIIFETKRKTGGPSNQPRPVRLLNERPQLRIAIEE